MGAVAGILGNGACHDTVRKMLDAMPHRGGGWEVWSADNYAVGTRGLKGPDELDELPLETVLCGDITVKYNEQDRDVCISRGYLGRDLVYYCATDQKDLVFATEVKALLACPGVQRVLDVDAFKLFISMRYLPVSKTMFSGICKLPAGSVINLARMDAAISRVHYAPSVSLGDPTKGICAAIEASVRSALSSAKKAGVFMSGGVDSSVVAAVAAKVVAERDRPLYTFCMGFGEDQDEIRKADDVACMLNTNHRDLIVSPSFMSDLPKMIYYADMPKRNLYTYYLFEMARGYVDTVLTGLGPDELFGGYAFKYNICDAVEKYRKINDPRISTAAATIISYHVNNGPMEYDHILPYLCRLVNAEDALVYAQIQVQDEPVTRPIWGRSANQKHNPAGWFRHHFENNDLLHGTMVADMYGKCVDDFIYSDSYMAAANGIDLRLPLLSDILVKIGFTIPPTMKYRGYDGKLPFKKAALKYLPREVVDRPKQHFSFNTFSNYVQHVRPMALDLLPDGWAVKLGLVKSSYLDRILSHPPTPNLDRQYCTIYNLVCFELFYEIFFAGDVVACPR